VNIFRVTLPQKYSCERSSLSGPGPRHAATYPGSGTAATGPATGLGPGPAADPDLNLVLVLSVKSH
jgi:hypothetical protein